MNRSEILIPLSQDHHHGLKLAMLISKDSPAYEGLPTNVEGKVRYTLNAWEKELSVHFKNEEEKLFPAVKGKDEQIDSLIGELLEQHDKIEQIVKSLEVNEAQQEKLSELGALLKVHIRKEERELFDRIQQVFSDEELKEIVEEIEPVKNE